MWNSVHFLSLSATHVLGQLNVGADLLTRGGGAFVREWKLHPAVAQIWDCFGMVGPLGIQRKHPRFPVLFLDRQQCTVVVDGCTGASVAQHTSVCISSSGNDSACTGESTSAGSVLDPCNSLVASKVVVCENNQSAGYGILATSSLQAGCGSPCLVCASLLCPVVRDDSKIMLCLTRAFLPGYPCSFQLYDFWALELLYSSLSIWGGEKISFPASSMYALYDKHLPLKLYSVWPIFLISLANPEKSKALSIQLIVEAISLAYINRGPLLPHDVKAYLTRGMATSWPCL